MTAMQRKLARALRQADASNTGRTDSELLVAHCHWDARTTGCDDILMSNHKVLCSLDLPCVTYQQAIFCQPTQATVDATKADGRQCQVLLDILCRLDDYEVLDEEERERTFAGLLRGRIQEHMGKRVPILDEEELHDALQWAIGRSYISEGSIYIPWDQMCADEPWLQH